MEGKAAIAAYAQAWCLYVWVPGIDALLGASSGAVDSRPLGAADVVLLPLALLGAISASAEFSALPLLAAHALKLGMFAWRMPFVWDHECWAALTELSFLVAPRHFWRLARGQLLLLYASAAWWKLNTSFLDPRTSCSTVILIQLLSAYAPSEHLAQHFAPVVARWAPLLGLGGEATIALLLLCWPRLGVLSALAFHLLVLLCPAPNFAGGFSVCCAARLLLLLPMEAAAQCRWSPWVALGAAVFAGVIPSAASAAYGALAFSVLQGLWRTKTTTTTTTTEAMTFSTFVSLLVLTVVYAFLLPVLGLQHMASCSMYANLKHYGGSNHLVVPTGLLQDWFHDFHGPWGPAFGGALWRLDAVDGAAALTARNAWTAVEPPLAVELLRSNGHSGRQFAAYYARLESLEAAGVSSYSPTLPLVFPAFELRRALRATSEGWRATLTRLPRRLRTPGEWRDFPGTQVYLWSNGSCSDESLQRWLETEPPWWLTKLLLPYPYPLLPDDDTEIHCSS
eukprot:s1307_g10.t1